MLNALSAEVKDINTQSKLNRHDETNSRHNKFSLKLRPSDTFVDHYRTKRTLGNSILRIIARHICNKQPSMCSDNTGILSHIALNKSKLR